MFRRAVIVALALLPACASRCFAVNHGTWEDYKFQTSHFMRRTAYRDSTKVGADCDVDGAYSRINEDYDAMHAGTWYIEQQREGEHAVAAGLADNDTDAIDRGLKILDWGWRQQQPGGGFRCGSIGRSFHSTSFFVEACAHSCLLLEASPFADRYRVRIDAMKPLLVRAVHWMESEETEGKRYNRPYTHRRYLVACAYGETGVLVDDHAMIDHSRAFVRDALRMQDPSGYNPEKSGYDVSYDAVGLNFAERYYWIVANKDLRERLHEMLRKNVAWLAGFVRPDGSVDTSGSTRVDGEHSEMSPLGVKKKLAVAEVYESFAGWAKISGDKSYEELAMKVDHGRRMRE